MLLPTRHPAEVEGLAKEAPSHLAAAFATVHSYQNCHSVPTPQDCWPHSDVADPCWVYSTGTGRIFLNFEALSVSDLFCVLESDRFFDKHILLFNLLFSPSTRKKPVWTVKKKKDADILKSLLSVTGPSIAHRLFSSEDWFPVKILILHVRETPSSSVPTVLMTCSDIKPEDNPFRLTLGLSFQLCYEIVTNRFYWGLEFYTTSY